VNLEAGTFRIVVQNDFSTPGALGPYALRVRPFPDCGACPGTSPAPCAEDGTLSGDFSTIDCEDADAFIYDVYELDLPAVRDVRISSRPGGVDVFLWMFREGCEPRLAFLSGGFGLGVLLEAGKYRIVVSSFAPGTLGSYSVSFSCREAAFCEPRCIAGTIACGQPASGVLVEEDCDFFATVLDVWRFDVPRGGASIRVREGSTGPTFFGAFPAACDVATRLDRLCQRDESGAFFCDLAPGSYLLNVSTSRNVILQQGPQPYTIEVVTSACGQFGDQLPGDCNQDGKLDLADGVCLLSHLFRGEPSVLSCEAGGLGLSGRSLLDWNGDRALNLTDPIALLVHLFQSGVPHVLGSECVPGAGCPRKCGG